jgi:hypothetical protein
LEALQVQSEGVAISRRLRRLELWSRCSTCGWSVLQLAQPHGERVPFVPPLPWTTIEEEIAAMRTAAIDCRRHPADRTSGARG